MNWHGYEQRDDAHPQWPWWRRGTLNEGYGWVRSDGRTQHLRGGEQLTDDEKAELRESVAKDGDATSMLIQVHDREHPLPAPEPKCLQVWKIPGNPAQVVIIEDAPWFPVTLMTKFTAFALTGEALLVEHAWPPPEAVLVAGPGSPWAPTKETT